MNMPNTPQSMGSLQPEVIQVTAIEAISRAEINQSIATARQHARVLPQVKQKMMNFACLDEETAASCFYTLPRGGKNIQGPSVRLAEIAVTCYGNLRAGTRIIETVTTGDSPHVTIQAVAMDLESNVSITIEKRRRIIGKKSANGAISEDDINLAANAGSAIAFRDAVFKIVPLALVKPVYEQAIRTAVGDAKSLNDRRAKCVESFAKMGVTKDRILAKLEKKSVEEIGLEDLETLIGLFTALKDGEVKIDEAFPAATTAPKPSSSAPAPVNVVPMKPVATPEAQRRVPQVAPDENPSESQAPAAVATQPASEPQAANPVTVPPGEPMPPEVTRESMQATPTPEQAPEGQEGDGTAPEPTFSASPTVVDPKDANEATAFITTFATRDGVTEDQIMGYLRSTKPPLAKAGQNLSDMSSMKLIAIAKGWNVPAANGKTICASVKELAGVA